MDLFQSPQLAESCDLGGDGRHERVLISIPAARRELRPGRPHRRRTACHFNPRSSQRAATVDVLEQDLLIDISIPAARRELRLQGLTTMDPTEWISIPAARRELRPRTDTPCCAWSYFNPRSSQRAATRVDNSLKMLDCISIPAARRELRRRQRRHVHFPGHISIPAARRELRLLPCSRSRCGIRFQSPQLAESCDRDVSDLDVILQISIPAARRELRPPRSRASRS